MDGDAADLKLMANPKITIVFDTETGQFEADQAMKPLADLTVAKQPPCAGVSIILSALFAGELKL